MCTGLVLVLTSCKQYHVLFNVSEQKQQKIISLATVYKSAKPETITSFVCPRSKGGIHDYYSEGDYWWPNPEDTDGAYIRKDGISNPDNFKEHRKALIRFNEIAGTLTTAYLLTGKKTYLKHIVPHLKAWFINEETRMNPSLWYAQAIKGEATGRGIGIIDTVHLIEVARAVEIMEEEENILSKEEDNLIKNWFRTYLNWLTTSPFGIEERDNGNNHSVTWALQVAVFAHLIKDNEKLDFCRRFYKTTLLPEQMECDGSFPLELVRTKPYGYSIFVMDAMSALCQVLSVTEDNLFNYTTEDGKSLEKGMEFLFPFLEDKELWPYAQDVMYWDDWPVSQPCLLFTGMAFNNTDYIKLWRTLKFDSLKNTEVTRNMPVKNPLLWININKQEPLNPLTGKVISHFNLKTELGLETNLGTININDRVYSH